MKAFFQFLFLTLTLCSCNRCSSDKPQSDIVEKPEDVDAHVRKQIENQLDKKGKISAIYISHAQLLASDHVQHAYQTEEYTGLWLEKGKLNSQGDSLLRILQNARDFGLIPGDYHLKTVDSLFTAANDKKTHKLNAVSLAEADILLTDAFFIFSTHLNKGRLRSDTILPEFRIKDVTLNLDSLFASVRKKRNFTSTFQSLEPPFEQYHLLKKELAKFRKQWEMHPWDTLPHIEKDTAAFYRSLKKMLVETRDYDSTAKGNDSVKLSKGIKHFQKRYYLEQDGKAGKNTMRILRLSTEDRIRQIEMNMERWRLETKQFPKRYVIVNIPQFEMKVFDDDTLYMESRVVVGLPEKPTPLLESKIQYIMLYPYWNVPYSIASKEILPVLKRDTSYLRKKNFDVVDWHGELVDPKTINWKRYTEKYLPYRFRQREGEDNSLGIMKFNFNNKYGVYLHDTNSKRYFKRDVRALSHGCMRLENYMDLARYLIRLDSVKYPFDSLEADIAKQEQKQVNLKKPIPIFTKYYSAFVDEDEGLMLFMDIYRRDELMERLLYKNK
jgi:murein L,D-transpeptidase YcbB/YkuD